MSASRRRGSVRSRVALGAYLLALLASWLVQALRPERPAQQPETDAPLGVVLDLPQQTRQGPAPGEALGVALHEWPAAPGSPGTPEVVLLLHGAPGSGEDFARLAPLLAARGVRVLAPDLPGSGDSSMEMEDASYEAKARTMLDLLDRLGIASAHVVGWSNGGGVALHMAELAPRRVASITLLASIGDQQFEWTGSYHVEHAKYRVGLALLGPGLELLPHFGLLGSMDQRLGWLRGFAQSDQRELTAIMRDLSAQSPAIPTLILHGEHDPLVPVDSAVHAHQLLGSSRLVILDASHFLPFLQPEETAEHVLALVAVSRSLRADAALRLPPEGGVLDLAPPSSRPHVLGLLDAVREGVKQLPWWAHFAGLLVLLAMTPRAGLAVAAVLLAGIAVDPFIAWCALLAAGLARSVRVVLREGEPGQLDPTRHWGVDWARRILATPVREGWRVGVVTSRGGDAARALLSTPAPTSVGRVLCVAGFWSACALGTLVASMLTLLVAGVGAGIADHLLAGQVAQRVPGIAGGIASLSLLVLGVVMSVALARGTPSGLSVQGWRRGAARLRRTLHHEYWPAWMFYITLAPALAWRVFVHREPIAAFTACNPAIGNGGGVVGEQKHLILAELARAAGPAGERFLLPHLLLRVEDGPRRIDALDAAVREGLLTYPLVLKPDAGERGVGFRVVRTREQASWVLAHVDVDMLAQAFAPGAHECGILWVRSRTTTTTTTTTQPRAEGTPAGRITGITRKEFPVLTGDGVRTLEDLIERHPRFRAQGPAFLTRLDARASEVVPEGVPVPLSTAGNHCQGTLFRDGTDLITPALEESIDRLCGAFGAGGLDVARVDVRYESDDLLRRGEGFKIVELNGVSSEPTHMYDPKGTLLWSLRIFHAHWARVWGLGMARVRAGVRPLRVREVLALARDRSRKHPGSSIAD